MHGLVSRRLIAKATKISVPASRKKMGAKYVGPAIRKMRFKAEKEFLPTQSMQNSFTMTPI